MTPLLLRLPLPHTALLSAAARHSLQAAPVILWSIALHLGQRATTREAATTTTLASAFGAAEVTAQNATPTPQYPTLLPATACPHTLKPSNWVSVRVCMSVSVCVLIHMQSSALKKGMANGIRNCRDVALSLPLSLSLAAITAIFHAFKFWFRLRKRFAICHFASPRNKSRIDWPLFTRVGSASSASLASAARASAHHPHPPVSLLQQPHANCSLINWTLSASFLATVHSGNWKPKRRRFEVFHFPLADTRQFKTNLNKQNDATLCIPLRTSLTPLPPTPLLPSVTSCHPNRVREFAISSIMRHIWPNYVIPPTVEMGNGNVKGKCGAEELLIKILFDMRRVK